MEKENSKVKGSGVPQNIPELETIEQTNQKFQDAWVNYLKNLSPRIKIIFPGDKEFNFEKIKSALLELKRIDKEEEGKIVWPEEELSFILIFNSSILEDKKQYFADNLYLFYFGNIAFSLRHFEMDSTLVDEENDTFEYHDTYSLSSYSKDLLEWKFIAKLIKNRIKELEEKVPPLPENFD